jgi:hypothetical protein
VWGTSVSVRLSGGLRHLFGVQGRLKAYVRCAYSIVTEGAGTLTGEKWLTCLVGRNLFVILLWCFSLDVVE